MRSYQRRQLILVGLLAVVLLMAGCGGGTPSPPPGPPEPVVNPDTAVIPDDGSVEIAEQTEDSITLSGAVPDLDRGDIMVSAIGEGLLRKVESVQTTGIIPQQGGTVVEIQTSQGTLEDLFESVDIYVEKSFGSSDFASMEPLVDGVTFGAGPSGLAPSALLEIPIDFDRVALVGPAHDPTVYVDGTGSFTLDCVVDIKIRAWRLQHFKFGPEIGLSLAAEIVAEAHVSVERKIKIGHLEGVPFTIWLPTLPPVPLVFTPVLDIFLKFDGTLEAGIEFTPTLEISATCGIEYQSSSGWGGFTDFQRQLDLGPMPDVNASASARIGLFCPQVSLRLYGIAGPYVTADLPYGEITYAVQTSPPQHVVDGWLGFEATVGALVEVLGHTLVDYEYPGLLLNERYHLFHTVFRQNSPPNVTVTSGPSGETTDTTPRFSWSGSDSDGTVVGYEYRMNSAGWTAVPSSVTSRTFGALAVGHYTFCVKAKDNDGDYSQIRCRSFTVVEETGDVPIIID